VLWGDRKAEREGRSTERAAKARSVAGKESAHSPVSLISSMLQCLDVLLVVFAVEALHLPSIALVDPSLERGIIFLEKRRGVQNHGQVVEVCANMWRVLSATTTDPLKPLQKCGLKLTNTTATGCRVEAVSLLESVEATWSKRGIGSER
jgi:ABC-type sulfate transport system permease subunit